MLDIDRGYIEYFSIYILGSLMYAMTSTRPDIAYAIGVASLFSSHPGKEHWDALVRIMRYLKGTID